jgi:hypothetical protein
MVEQAKTTANPASTPAAQAPRRKRIPMSVPLQKLQVDELPGFHLHWFRETNVPRAMDAGYEIVHREEIHVNQHGIATSRDLSGNTDLGSTVSIIGTPASSEGAAERLILMKIKEEWYREDRKLLNDRNAQIMGAIFGDEKIIGPEGKINELGQLEYVKQALLNRPARKANPNQR